MDDPIARVAFLANSENRVAVLEHLEDASLTRSRLSDRLTVSRVTIGRILEELEERHWIAREDDAYRLTPLGEIVVEEFGALLEAMDLEGDLRSILPQLPADDLGFDVRRLADAEVVRPTQGNPIPHVDRLAAELGAASRVRVLAFSVVQPALAASSDATLAGDQTFAAVLTPGVYDVMTADEDMRTPFLDMLATDAAEYYVCDADLPALFTADERTLLLLTDDEGTSRGMVVSEDPTVFEWAVDTFEAYREAGDPVDRERFLD